MLARVGKTGSEFFVIVGGEVSVTKDEADVRRLSAGDVFGEIALSSDSARRTATRHGRDTATVLRPHATGVLAARPQPCRDRAKILEALEEPILPAEQASPTVPGPDRHALIGGRVLAH